MKKGFIVFLLANILVISFSVGVSAEDIYVANSTSGNNDGLSCANSHSVLWFNTATNWGSETDKVGPGDTVHLCGIISSSLIVQGSGSAGSPITIFFEPNAKMSASYWASSRVIYSSNKDFIIIDGGLNGVIEATDCGSTSLYGGSYSNSIDSVGIYLSSSDNWEIKNLDISNLYVRTPDSNDSNDYGLGIYAASSNNLSIHHCFIKDMHYGLKIGAGRANTNNLRIHNCDISRTSTAIVLTLEGAYNYSDLRIYNNAIYDNYVWDGVWNNGASWFHNDGIHTWGNFVNNVLGPLEIYGNKIGGDFGKHTTAWIYLSDYTYPAKIYNNILYTTAEATSNGMIAFHSYSASASVGIYNNVIKGIASDNTGGTKIRFTGLGGYTADVANNILPTGYVGIDDGATNPVVITSDYNDFYNINQVGKRLTTWYEDLEDWQTYLGGCPGSDNDCNSLTSDPLLVNPASRDFHLQPGSPAIDNGTDLSAYFTTDKDGNIRPSGAWDIGAYEYISGGTTSCSPADTNFNSVVEITELINYISQWKSGDVVIGDLITAIGEWKNGC